MAHLFARLEFRKDSLVDWLLRSDKTLQIKSVGGLFGTTGRHSTGCDNVPGKKSYSNHKLRKA